MPWEKRMRYFEDFTVGEIFSLAPVCLSANDRLVFFAAFEGGSLSSINSLLADASVALPRNTAGGSLPDAASFSPSPLTLSPWHVATAVWGKWVATKTDAGGMIAGMSIDFARWYRCASTGDLLFGTVTISRKRVFSGGDAGSVSFVLDVMDAHQRRIMDMEVTGKMQLHSPLDPRSLPFASPKRPEKSESSVLQVWHPTPFSLTEEEIMAFGRAFDDRPIHVSREAAAKGPFGGLIASGLHSMARLLGIWRATILKKESDYPQETALAICSARWLSPVRPAQTILPSITLTKTENAPDGRVSLYFINRLADEKNRPLLVCVLKSTMDSPSLPTNR